MMAYHNRFTYHAFLLSAFLHMAAIIVLGIIFEMLPEKRSLPHLSQSAMRAYLDTAHVMNQAVTPAKNKNSSPQDRKALSRNNQVGITSGSSSSAKSTGRSMATSSASVATGERANVRQKVQQGDETHVVSELIALLHAAIQEKQRYPAAAMQMGREGRVTLAFILHKNGAISNLRIAKVSGTASLDQAAVDAVNAAVPFKAAEKYLKKSSDAAQEYQIDVVFELTA